MVHRSLRIQIKNGGKYYVQMDDDAVIWWVTAVIEGWLSSSNLGPCWSYWVGMCVRISSQLSEDVKNKKWSVGSTSTSCITDCVRRGFLRLTRSLHVDCSIERRNFWGGVPRLASGHLRIWVLRDVRIDGGVCGRLREFSPARTFHLAVIFCHLTQVKAF